MVRVLVEHGYQQTRFRDVAEVSGVAISTLQTYFGSREDMLVEALRTATDGETSAMRHEVAQVADPWDRLLLLVDRGLETPAPVWRMLMEFWTAAAHDEELREHSVSLQQRYREPFETVLREGVDSGAFRTAHDAEALADLIVACLDGLLYPRVLAHPRPVPAALRTVLLDQLQHALGVER